MTGAKALRIAVALAVLATTAGLLTSSALATSSEKNLPALNRQVLAAVNKFRVAHGLVALRQSSALDRAARQHSLEMGKRGYFGHHSANGSAFWQRLRRYYRPGHYSSWSVGENLLWAAPSIGVSRAMKLWIASPEHLRNLLTATWRDLGVSAVTVSHAPGIFRGRRVTIITTDFGVRD